MNMKRAIAIVATIFGLYLIMSPGWSVEEPDLPFGVSPEEWVAISDTMGLVVELKEGFQWAIEGQLPHPRVEAILMTKIQGKWTVIDWPTEPEQFEFKPLE